MFTVWPLGQSSSTEPISSFHRPPTGRSGPLSISHLLSDASGFSKSVDFFPFRPPFFRLRLVFRPRSCSVRVLRRVLRSLELSFLSCAICGVRDVDRQKCLRPSAGRPWRGFLFLLVFSRTGSIFRHPFVSESRNRRLLDPAHVWFSLEISSHTSQSL